MDTSGSGSLFSLGEKDSLSNGVVPTGTPIGKTEITASSDVTVPESALSKRADKPANSVSPSPPLSNTPAVGVTALPNPALSNPAPPAPPLFSQPDLLTPLILTPPGPPSSIESGPGISAPPVPPPSNESGPVSTSALPGSPPLNGANPATSGSPDRPSSPPNDDACFSWEGVPLDPEHPLRVTHWATTSRVSIMLKHMPLYKGTNPRKQACRIIAIKLCQAEPLLFPTYDWTQPNIAVHLLPEPLKQQIIKLAEHKISNWMTKRAKAWQPPSKSSSDASASVNGGTHILDMMKDAARIRDRKQSETTLYRQLYQAEVNTLYNEAYKAYVTDWEVTNASDINDAVGKKKRKPMPLVSFQTREICKFYHDENASLPPGLSREALESRKAAIKSQLESTDQAVDTAGSKTRSSDEIDSLLEVFRNAIPHVPHALANITNGVAITFVAIPVPGKGIAFYDVSSVDTPGLEMSICEPSIYSRFLKCFRKHVSTKILTQSHRDGLYPELNPASTGKGDEGGDNNGDDDDDDDNDDGNDGDDGDDDNNKDTASNVSGKAKSLSKVPDKCTTQAQLRSQGLLLGAPDSTAPYPPASSSASEWSASSTPGPISPVPSSSLGTLSSSSPPVHMPYMSPLLMPPPLGPPALRVSNPATQPPPTPVELLAALNASHSMEPLPQFPVGKVGDTHPHAGMASSTSSLVQYSTPTFGNTHEQASVMSHNYRNGGSLIDESWDPSQWTLNLMNGFQNTPASSSVIAGLTPPFDMVAQGQFNMSNSGSLGGLNHVSTPQPPSLYFNTIPLDGPPSDLPPSFLVLEGVKVPAHPAYVEEEVVEWDYWRCYKYLMEVGETFPGYIKLSWQQLLHRWFIFEIGHRFPPPKLVPLSAKSTIPLVVKPFVGKDPYMVFTAGGVGSLGPKTLPETAWAKWWDHIRANIGGEMLSAGGGGDLLLMIVYFALWGSQAHAFPSKGDACHGALKTLLVCLEDPEFMTNAPDHELRQELKRKADAASSKRESAKRARQGVH